MNYCKKKNIYPPKHKEFCHPTNFKQQTQQTEKNRGVIKPFLHDSLILLKTSGDQV